MAIQITVKDVDEATFSELKTAAIKQKITVGNALNIAMHTWLSEQRKPKLKLTEWKTFNGGKGTEHLSEEIDDILYA